MRHVEDSFIGQKGLKLSYQGWLADKPKALVQISHGIAEHGGRYARLAEALVSSGFSVYAADHRGHGRSEGQRCYVDNFDQYVDDELAFSAILRQGNPGQPLFLLGHSMGSTIALRYAARRESDLAGLIISGAGLAVGGKVSPILRAMASLISGIAPRLMLPPGDLSQFLSHDQAVVEAYRNDPLVCGEKISARLGAQMLKVFPQNAAIAQGLSLPLLYQVGGEDKLVLDGPALAQYFKMKDATLRIYPGLFHEVYNEAEPERSAVIADLKDWIAKRV